MGSVIICRYDMAKKPYIIEKENLKIFSTEELCFYLIHHIYDIDNTIINGALANWLRTEVKATHAAGVLNQQISARVTLIKMLETILLELDYLSEEDIHKIVYKQALPITPSEEAENLGNMFLQQEKYENAVKAFRKALRYRKQEREDDIGEALIYEKIGIAYARLFLYDEASRYFALSYMKNPLSKVKQLYESAVGMGGTVVEGMEEDSISGTNKFYYRRNELEKSISEESYMEILKKIDEVHSLKASGRTAEYQKELDEIIESWKLNVKNSRV